jgi:hypothetical protein
MEIGEMSGLLTNPIRQNTFLIARGMSLFGFSCSAAVKPTTSLPEYANAAIISTLQKPYHPLCAAPGIYQYMVPMACP